MKKTVLLLILLALKFAPAKAQWVTIPDANFVTWLTQNYPSCMNGNMMDTTCFSITNENYVFVQNSNIADITGIQYFDALTDLDCSDNQLTFLPKLPNTMSSLNIEYNNITCIYNLPTTIQDSVGISNNPFTCVPNQTSYSLGLPLCIDNDPFNNPNNCTSTVDISGFVFTDQNSNCLYNMGDLTSNNVPVKLYNSQNNLVAQNNTVNGVYGFSVAAPGNYKVKIGTVNLPFAMACTQADSQMVNLVSLNSGILNVNFPIQCNQTYDVIAQAVNTQGIVFPGQIHTLNTNVTNNETWYNLNCNASAFSGTVSIQVSGPVSYISAAANALIPQVNGNTFTYSITDFNNLSPASFGLKFKTDTTAQANDQICVHVQISTTPADAIISNNTYDFCYNVVNSYDPNIKEVYPVNVLVGYEDWFTYTIHFQNTGSAPAFNIKLTDNIDNKLNLNTFEVLGFSHDAITSFSGNQLTIRFNNIMLPDSTTNPQGSIGYFQYRVKPKPNLANGTQISNTAYIYFDFNAPIITNTTKNIFGLTGIEQSITNKNEFIVHPNPSTGIFTFNSDSYRDSKNIKTIEVYNLMGELILSQGNAKQINLSEFPKGIYVARINGQFVSKLVKE